MSGSSFAQALSLITLLLSPAPFLPLSYQDKIGELKDKLVSRVNASKERLRLIYHGRPLNNDEETLDIAGERHAFVCMHALRDTHAHTDMHA